MEYKPGYLLKVTTYENDGDYYRINEFSGLERQHVSFLLEVCDIFKSSYEGGKGNADTEEFSLKKVNELIQNLVDGYENPPEEWINPDKEYRYDLLIDLIGLWDYGESWRVFDGFEVFYVPEESIKNVTDQFISE